MLPLFICLFEFYFRTQWPVFWTQFSVIRPSFASLSLKLVIILCQIKMFTRSIQTLMTLTKQVLFEMPLLDGSYSILYYIISFMYVLS